MQTLKKLKKLKGKQLNLPTWKQCLMLALVIALGILLGRLLLNRWQLALDILLVLAAIILLLKSGKRKLALRSATSTTTKRKRGK